MTGGVFVVDEIFIFLESGYILEEEATGLLLLLELNFDQSILGNGELVFEESVDFEYFLIFGSEFHDDFGLMSDFFSKSMINIFRGFFF